MHILIKNMVCDRCRMMVEAEFKKLGLTLLHVQLGEVEIVEDKLTPIQLKSLELNLKKLGFELLTNRKMQWVVKIKRILIELVHYGEGGSNVNLSVYLSKKLELNYTYLSAVFSELEHDTIEHFFIRLKIEKAKELLSYGEKSLTEIAYFLNYSSVAHLSAQFKKVTNQTASSFRKANQTKRITLDEI